MQKEWYSPLEIRDTLSCVVVAADVISSLTLSIECRGIEKREYFIVFDVGAYKARELPEERNIEVYIRSTVIARCGSQIA